MAQKKVVIVDYGLGNLFSVKQACLKIGLRAEISEDKREVITADALIIPGVGAFHEAMLNLKKLDLVEPIKAKVDENIPVFGVCLGQQLLFSESEEFGSGRGLDIIKGSIKRFKSPVNGRKIRIPQIAWNKIYAADNSWQSTPFEELTEAEYMYFVHSYFVSPEDSSCALSVTDYEGFRYCSSILKNNVFATQFHPEKSSEKGLTIYRNWANQNRLYDKREEIA